MNPIFNSIKYLNYFIVKSYTTPLVMFLSYSRKDDDSDCEIMSFSEFKKLSFKDIHFYNRRWWKGTCYRWKRTKFYKVLKWVFNVIGKIIHIISLLLSLC